ncbi:MAG: ribonuclease HII [Gemmatimonadetes bacterium]|nr:ribonuclease HII [Gemmatimonadota bacterium]
MRYERRLWEDGIEHVAGVDEVGRGPLAGPVVAAAVILPRDARVSVVTDSKLLAPDERDEAEAAVRAAALAVGVGAASPREVDRDGITGATRSAIRRALEGLRLLPGHVVVDGRPVKGLGWRHEGVVKADFRIHCVACASVIAKVCRDRLMERLHPRYPAYGWDRNKGYGTGDHRDALGRCGPTPHHRLSFGGVVPGETRLPGRGGPT